MHFNLVLVTRAGEAIPHLQSLKGATVVINGGRGGLSGHRGEVIEVAEILVIRTLKGEDFGMPWDGIETLEIL